MARHCKGSRVRRVSRSRVRRCLLEGLEPRLLLAADWQNPLDATDVNGDGQTAPSDVLVVINDLNTSGARTLPSRPNNAVSLPPFLDVNGDRSVSAIDALIPINRLNQKGSGSSAAGSRTAGVTNAVATIDRTDLVNVDAQLKTQFSGIFTNRRTFQSTTNVRVTNTSATAIATPLILVIESISDPTVIVANADTMTSPDGKPLFNLTGQVPGNTLDPGESTGNRALVFSNPNLRPFTVKVSVSYQQVTPVTPQVTLEIPGDALGRKFIGAPDGVTLTVRAQGTDPVTVGLGQAASGAGSRGAVLFGASGTSTMTTVTTSGGANNFATIRVRGDAAHPSAFQGDLKLTASVAGTQVTAEQVTVLKIVIDQHTSELVNDIPVTRTITTIPATPGITIDLDFFRGQLVEGGILPPLVPTEKSVNIFPASGSTLTTGANGTVEFQMQQGPAGQGAVTGQAEVVSADGSPGATLQLAADLTTETFCEVCLISKQSPQDSGPTSYGSPSVQLFSGAADAQDTDAVVPGRGFGFVFSRSYNSQASHLREVATGDFGVDWAFSYSDDRLIADLESVIHISPSLRGDTFIPSGEPGEYIAPLEFYQQLTINGAGDFEIRDADGMVNTYEGFDNPLIPGRLVRIEDTDGNFMTFHYAQIDPNTALAGDEKQVLGFIIDTLGREIRYEYYASADQIVDGRTVTTVHPGGNAAAWGRLAHVIDFKGNMDFDGVDESEDFPGQANNRMLSFDYDSEGNLTRETSPAVLGTPNGNDFVNGKTYRYVYMQDADITGSITGLDRQRLLHNLVSVESPNENALDPGNPSRVLTYGTDPADAETFDRVLTYTIGGTNLSDVPAGGTIQYSYEFVSPVAIDTNDPYLATTVTDRRGNVTRYTYSPFDTLLEERELTRGFRAGEPSAFVTRYQYNIDKELVRETLPEGNVIRYVYDDGNPDRFQQGNLIETVEQADSVRRGDQTQIRTGYVYEPIYQQPAFITDPRGLDPSFAPPLPDPSGRTQRERYTTHYFYDYQEAAPALVLPLLAAELNISEAEVLARLTAAGVALGLGDLNGDGDVSPQAEGDIIRMEQPSIVLLAGSNQAAIEGDQLQEIVTRYHYNQFGQMTSMVDPEANVQQWIYFPENDPDGDGVLTPAPADGRILNSSTGGYLAKERRDTASDPLRNNRANPTPVDIQINYTYDDVGNMVSLTDGRGIRTDYFVNELNQVVQTTRAAAVPPSGPGDADEPLQLVDFDYLKRTYYDFNDNVVLAQVEDRGNTSLVDGNPPVSDLPIGVPGAANPDPLGGTAFVDTVHKYDILDNEVEMVEEVLNPSAGVPPFPAGEYLRMRYRYDANENLVLAILPEGNATSAIYDERDLLFRTTRGALVPPELDPSSPPPTSDTLLSPSDPTNYDVRGGINCQCTTYRYDGNQNIIETVDADDTDLSPDNNSPLGPGDRTRYVYDGFDRQTSLIDSVGNQTVFQYDPASNLVRTSRFGPVGGPSPTSDGPTALPGPVSINGVIQAGNLVSANLLQAAETLYDELNRAFQYDQVLFVNTIPTMRSPDVADGASDIGKGDLTPGDSGAIPGVAGVSFIGRVTTRTDYDRKSRPTFRVEDDEDTYRMDYDGADRVIRRLDPEGNTVESAYDDNNNLIETRETDVAQVTGVADEIFLTTYFYDSLNRQQQLVDNLGQAIFYRYDSRNNPVSMADAQGPLTGETIDRRAFVGGALTVNVINDFGNVTRYFYDGLSRRTREEVVLTKLPAEADQPDSASGDGIHVGASIFGVKDDPSAPESFTTPPDPAQGSGDGLIRTGFTYDRNSLQSSLLDDNGNITLYLYDNLNRRVTETKGLVVTSPFTENFILGARRVVTPTAATINDPASIPEAQIQTQLDQAALRDAAIAALFPPLADDVASPPPPPQATTIVYGYDPDNNILILEDENDSEIFTRYDAINRAIAVRIFRAGQSDLHADDPVFAPAPAADPDGPHRGPLPPVVGTNKQDSQYDGQSRMVRGTDNNDPTSMDDDSLITFAYDSLSRVIEETQKIGSLDAKAISSGWRAENLRSSLIYPNDRQLTYTYDGLDRHDTVSDAGAGLPIAGYDYIGTDRVLERAYPQNGTRMTYLNDAGTSDTGYDGLRRPVELRHLRGDDSLIVGFTYSYDRMNNKLEEAKLHDAANSEIYSYDSAYRLVDFERPGAGAIDPLHSDWQLDGLGNWQQVTSTESGSAVTETREHSSFNEVIHREDGLDVDLEYDDNGSLTIDGQSDYGWDALNRLRTVTRMADGALVATYSYDALGRRIRKEVTNSGALDGTTDFYLDHWQEIEEHDGADSLKQQYVLGLYSDELLVLDRDLDGNGTAIAAADQRFTYHQNTVFSVFALTDDVAAIVEGYQYDAYGRPIVYEPGGNGSVDFGGDDVITPNKTSAVQNPFLLTGRRFDSESVLYYFRTRYESPTLGRFLSRDPLGFADGTNLYRATFVPNGVDTFGTIFKTINIGPQEVKAAFAGGDGFWTNDDSNLWFTGWFYVTDLEKRVPDPEKDVAIGVYLRYRMHVDTSPDTEFNGNVWSGPLYEIRHEVKGKEICCTAKKLKDRHVIETETMNGLGISGSFSLEAVKTVVPVGEECEWRAHFDLGFSFTGSSASGWAVKASVSGEAGNKVAKGGAELGAEVSGTTTVNWQSAINLPSKHIDFKKNGKKV